MTPTCFIVVVLFLDDWQKCLGTGRRSAKGRGDGQADREDEEGKPAAREGVQGTAGEEGRGRGAVKDRDKDKDFFAIFVIFAIFQKYAQNMQKKCQAHVKHMSNICQKNVKNMSKTCKTYRGNM